MKLNRVTRSATKPAPLPALGSLFARVLPLIVALIASISPARADGFNVDFGTKYGVPAVGYGAASGQSGTWNLAGLGLTALTDVSGGTPGVTVNVIAGVGTGGVGAVPVNDDQLLLNDNVFSVGSGWSLGFKGISSGDYLVYLYAPSNTVVQTGALNVGGTPVASIPGTATSTLIEGTSWVMVKVNVASGKLLVTGTGVGNTGLAGIQVVPAPEPVGFNVDLGTKYGTPVVTYGAAAGQLGAWNLAGLGVTALTDVNGGTLGVDVNVTAGGGTGGVGAVPTNDDELLLNDNVFTAVGGGWSVDFTGLPDGDYLVHLYAPSNSAVATGALNVGGTLIAGIPGTVSSTLIEGVSWARAQTSVVGGTLAIAGTGPGNTGLAGIQLVPIAAAESYCAAGSSASGCQALISSSGFASASAISGFTLNTVGVEGAKDGLYFFGTNGRQANNWGSGTSFQCVIPPVVRGGLLSSVGTSGACDGSFSQDLNALWCATCPKPAKNPGVGAVVQAQLWYRDPFNTSNQTTSLSDAIEFTVVP